MGFNSGLKGLISHFLVLNLPLPISFSIHTGSYWTHCASRQAHRNSQNTLLPGLRKYVNTAMRAHEISANSYGLWPSNSVEKIAA
jgi:hypothetical protein